MFSFVSLLLPPAQEEVWQKTQRLAQKHERTLNCWMFECQLLTSAAAPNRGNVLHASNITYRVQQESGQDTLFLLNMLSGAPSLPFIAKHGHGNDVEAVAAGSRPGTWLRSC